MRQTAKEKDVEKLLTKRELATVLGVSTRTVDRLIAEGVDFGKVVLRKGRTVRFDPRKVQRVIDQGGTKKRK